MVKGLIDENNLINIADAIREKTGENGVYYPFEMADKILSIQTGGGGLELTTSLVLTSNVTKTTGSVVLTGVLKADYDTVDTDLHGFLSNATILLYDGNDVLLDTGVTNDSGVVTFNETISGDTTFYCVFDGTSDYEACISNEVTVEYQGEIILYQPTLDGSESKYQITGSTTIANGEMYGGSAYLTTGWDNTGNWKLTYQQLAESAGCGVYLKLPNSTCRDYDEILIAQQTQNEGIVPYIYTGSRVTSEDRQTFKQFNQFNKWYDVTITKTSNNTCTISISNGETTLSNTYTSNILSSSQLCIGVDSWSGISHIKNIKVVSLSGE